MQSRLSFPIVHALPQNDLPIAAYVHIPFCRRRCYYCDFPVAVVGDRLRGETSGTIAQYVDYLCQEVLLTPRLGTSLATIFFGGGTPSLLSVAQVARILQTLDHQFGIASGAEISLEIDPGTFDLPQLQGYCQLGINRISLGVQAFQPELLAVCGRTHQVADIFTSRAYLQTAGVTNWSLDLISGLPHQTLEQWQDSLKQAIDLNPTHISTYDLIVESVTAFGRQYQPGVEPLPTETIAAQMYRTAQQMLTQAGYAHYEISNYARSDYQCRHNRVYWENRPFYGFGMGAASYVGGDRFTRPRKTGEYYQWVDDRKQGKPRETIVPAATEVLLDTLMLGLRLAEGLSLPALQACFGADAVQRILECVQPHCRSGWVEVKAIGYLRLTDPEGFLFSNTVLADLFSAFEP